MSDMLDPRWFPVLVTGGAGFVGSGLVRRLAEATPRSEIHVLLRDPAAPTSSGRGAAAWRLVDLLPRVIVHPCDLTDRDAVMATLARIRPRAVMHLAAAGAHGPGSDLRQMAQVNLVGTLNLLEAAADAGAAVFVNIGSSSEYGIKQAPMRETDRAMPATLYALTKVAQTKLSAALSVARGLDLVTLRLFSVYGPGEKPEALIPAAIRAIRAGTALRLGDPAAVHDFIYIEDAVDAMLALDRFKGMRGEVLNIGTGVQSTNREVVETVQAVLGQTGTLEWGALQPRPADSPVWVADAAAAAARIGWTASTSLRAGISRTAEWMAARPDRSGAANP